MKAFGIFAGGGVKGAALAGALAEAQDQGVQFVGYGGASAGSMVALLAAVGYSGEELGAMLVAKDFSKFLEDAGTKLNAAKSRAESVSHALRSGACSTIWALAFSGRNIVKTIGADFGLYSGDRLRDFLMEKIKSRMPALQEHADITFEALEGAGCLPVKIVATDITLREPALFSRNDTKYGASVIEAVRASAGYPFVFKPLLMHGYRLVDGGLSSNLPAFLFADEYREHRVPTIAFDLTASPSETVTAYDLGMYGQDLMTTALETSDKLMKKVLRGVHYVGIETPKGIDTLDFGISKDKRRQLYEAGRSAAGAFLSSFPPIMRAKLAGDQLTQQLRTEYGSPQRFVAVLRALAREIESVTAAREVRANIMLPTGRPQATRIVVYHHGFDHDSDVDLELPENAGCSGKAWERRTAVLADLEIAARDPAKWQMTPEQHAKVSHDRKSMISVPIHRERLSEDTDRPPPIGTLSVDSATPLQDTGWLERTSRGEVAHAEVVDIMMRWAYIAYHLLSAP